MSVIALPAGFCPRDFSLRLFTVQRAFGGPYGGSEQVIDMMQDRWMASMSLPPVRTVDAGRIEAFIAAMRGMTNTVMLHHFGQPIPRGTMRGAPTTINNPAAKGSSSIQIAATVGATLMAGDMLGISGLLLQVAEDCAASGAGNITVPLVNRLRKSIPAGSLVSWDRPTAPFRMSSTPSVQYVPGYAEGLSLDFVEDVS